MFTLIDEKTNFGTSVLLYKILKMLQPKELPVHINAEPPPHLRYVMIDVIGGQVWRINCKKKLQRKCQLVFEDGRCDVRM